MGRRVRVAPGENACTQSRSATTNGPIDYRFVNWFFNKAFWFNVGVNVVSAAIIAMAATLVLSVAIYEKVDNDLGRSRIIWAYVNLLAWGAITIGLITFYRHLSRRRVDARFMLAGFIPVTAVVAAVYLINIWLIQMTNLVNTIEITPTGEPPSVSSVLPHLRYDEFGNPRYMDDVPYSAR